MILQDHHVIADLKELWQFNSFRARIFFAIFPTTIALLVGYFALDRARPYEYFAEESFIVPSSGKGGDQITVNWRVNRLRQCPGTVERQLVDLETGIIIAAYDPVVAGVNAVDPEGKFLRRTFTLPRVIPTGYIGYQARLTYQCNWLQAMFPGAFSIRYSTPRLKFKVEE